MSDTYDLFEFKAPVSRGGLLRTLVGLAEAPGTGAALANKFLGDIGVEAFRAAEVDEPLPTEHPVLRDARALGGGGEATLELPAQGPSEGRADFPFETAAALTAAYRAGRTTPSEVAERVIAAVQASDAASPPLRALLAQHADEVRQMAEGATARWAAGEPLGPLDGVPVAVKDELDQRGYPTTVGTTFMGKAKAAQDATVVARLRAAGAVLIGKANMHEVGIGVTGVNPHFGAARNPYDPARATGGSSSGSAAAVAAGLCPIAIGADGGGSIRIPASLCGVVGLKATFGRISEHGAAPLCWSVAHVGPIAASVRDAAAAYAVMAGPDPLDGNTSAQPAVALDGLDDLDLKGLRLGIFRPWFEHAEPAVVAACDRAVEALVARGATVVPIEVRELALLRTAHLVTITSEMHAALQRYFKHHRRDLGLDTRLNLALAGRLLAADYAQAQRVRQRFHDRFMDIFQACDVVLTPSTGRTAPLIHRGALKAGESNLAVTEQIMRFAPLGNLVGLPGLSVPCGYDDEGLPVGLQIMGPAWQEGRLLRVGAAVEADAPGRAPAVHHRLLPSP